MNTTHATSGHAIKAVSTRLLAIMIPKLSAMTVHAISVIVMAAAVVAQRAAIILLVYPMTTGVWLFGSCWLRGSSACNYPMATEPDGSSLRFMLWMHRRMGVQLRCECDHGLTCDTFKTIVGTVEEKFWKNTIAMEMGYATPAMTFSVASMKCLQLRSLRNLCC